ncbi:MAG TPA: hypothetical protein VIV58_27070 [Kofleriaceae bacterium]
MKTLALLVTLAACTTGTDLPAARFANAPIVTKVNDRLDVPVQPATREFMPSLYNVRGLIHRRITRGLELRRSQRALGVNALDEVPDSTWFTNRIGIRDLTPEEIQRGPLTGDSPELHRPWTVRSTKAGGATIGFVIVDARGIKYILKFDDTGASEQQTAIDVIVNRLLWAAGYNVPEDEIVYFRDEDLVVAPDAAIKDGEGNKVGPLDRKGLEDRLAQIDHGADGRIRGLVSRWIAGKTVGGHASEGTRRDDPNDVIPHELRRDLRGAFPVFAWVDHVDVHEGNFVDSWITDAADKARHYLVHYFIDFGRSLGGMALSATDWHRGHTYVVDFADIGRSLVTFGLVDPAWKDRPRYPAKQVASFDATTFVPGDWHPDWPSYVPFLTSDRFDKFWGAKLVARFTPEQIAAAIEAGRLREPEAAQYLLDTLLERRQLTLKYWFARVAPIDAPAVSAAGDLVDLCFDDLAVRYGVAAAATTSYALQAHDWHGRVLAPAVSAPASLSGHACARLEPASVDDDGGYTIVRITVRRPGFTGSTLIHLGRDPATGSPRVIGLWRE